MLFSKSPKYSSSAVDCFSLGLSFYEIMNISIEEVEKFLFYTYREEIISWLQWNDSNGIYSDKDSLTEFGKILSKNEAVKIMIRQLRDC